MTRNHHNAQNLVLAERVLVMENINHKSIKRRTLVYDRAGRPSHRTMSPPHVVVGLQWNGLSSCATSRWSFLTESDLETLALPSSGPRPSFWVYKFLTHSPHSTQEETRWKSTSRVTELDPGERRRCRRGMTPGGATPSAQRSFYIEDPPPHEIKNDVEIKRKTKFLLNNEIFSVFPSCSFDARLRDVLLCNTFSSSITR